MELKKQFSPNKRAHYELCALVPDVIKYKDDLSQLIKILSAKWFYLLPAKDSLEIKKDYLRLEDKLLTDLLSEDADPKFPPNIRELL